MTARSSTASSNAMSDSSFINLTNQNRNPDSESFRFDFEIFLDVKTFFCNDIDLEKANHHILNRYVTYRVSQYAFLGIENYDLWICIQTDFLLFIENHLNQLNDSIWKILLDYCYSHEYWVDHDSKRKLSANFMKTISLDAEYNFNWIKNQIKWIEYNCRYLFKNIQQRKHELYDIILIEMSVIILIAMSKVILIIETSVIITAYSHSQQTHSQDVRKDVRYQSVSQLIDQPTQLIIQSVDQASVIQTSLRQASLQSLYSHLSYNSFYAAINQLYHSYSQSFYESINQYASINLYALFESPRSSYVINQIRFISQASQSNLSQSVQSASASQLSQSSSFLFVFASQSASESVQFNQSYISNDWFRQLTLLNKIYKKDEKFNDTNSNFDFKVLKFYDKCRRARLFEHAYLQNVLIMLSNKALDYFYSNLQFCYSFHDFCVNIKHYFENSEWYRINLTRWQIINISEIVAVNSNLSLFECLRKMCFEISTIQKDLNSAFVDSIQLRKNIIRVCRDHFALINELNNASINVSDLINALHTSVMNYEAIRKQHDSQQIYLQQNDLTQQIYLNDLTQQIHLLNQDQSEFENQYCRLQKSVRFSIFGFALFFDRILTSSIIKKLIFATAYRHVEMIL